MTTSSATITTANEYTFRKVVGDILNTNVVLYTPGGGGARKAQRGWNPSNLVIHQQCSYGSKDTDGRPSLLSYGSFRHNVFLTVARDATGITNGTQAYTSSIVSPSGQMNCAITRSTPVSVNRLSGNGSVDLIQAFPRNKTIWVTFALSILGDYRTGGNVNTLVEAIRLTLITYFGADPNSEETPSRELIRAAVDAVVVPEGIENGIESGIYYHQGNGVPPRRRTVNTTPATPTTPPVPEQPPRPLEPDEGLMTPARLRDLLGVNPGISNFDSRNSSLTQVKTDYAIWVEQAARNAVEIMERDLKKQIDQVKEADLSLRTAQQEVVNAYRYLQEKIQAHRQAEILIEHARKSSNDAEAIELTTTIFEDLLQNYYHAISVTKRSGSISSGMKVVALTKNIVCTSLSEGFVADIGQFVVTITDTVIDVERLDKLKLTSVAPHNNGGSPCFGTKSGVVGELLAKREYHLVLLEIIRNLMTVESSSYYVTLRAYCEKYGIKRTIDSGLDQTEFSVPLKGFWNGTRWVKAVTEDANPIKRLQLSNEELENLFDEPPTQFISEVTEDSPLEGLLPTEVPTTSLEVIREELNRITQDGTTGVVIVDYEANPDGILFDHVEGSPTLLNSEYFEEVPFDVEEFGVEARTGLDGFVERLVTARISEEEVARTRDFTANLAPPAPEPPQPTLVEPSVASIVDAVFQEVPFNEQEFSEPPVAPNVGSEPLSTPNWVESTMGAEL